MKSLAVLRKEIDAVDEQLLLLLAKRLVLVKSIGKEKKRLGKSVRDNKREKELVDILSKKGESLGLTRQTIEKVWMTFFEIAYIIEE